MALEKRAFTLIELIIVIVITAILAVGTFKAIEIIYKRSQKVKAISQMSFEAQALVNQLGILLYDRIPSSIIGYNPKNGDFKPLDEIEDDDENYTVLEWIAVERDALDFGAYSTFIDLEKIDKDTNTTYSPLTSKSKVRDIIESKFGVSSIYDNHIVNLVFAGSFDDGGLEQDFNDSFGWHGHDSNASLDINISDNGYITITDEHQPEEIFEKYFLVDSAYALARGEDINDSYDCFEYLRNSGIKLDKNTLYLFYNYRPWNKETFCGDPEKNATVRGEGNVTVLMQGVSTIEAITIDRVIRFKVEAFKEFKWGDKVHISKQKVVF